MTNETTASQPKVKCVEPEDWPAHYDKTDPTKGTNMDSVVFGASQPKSIGDDAQLPPLSLDEQAAIMELYDAAIAQGGSANNIILNLVRADRARRAPAAQASATLQFLHNVCADVLLALRNCDRQPLADLLEAALRDLPASATIQAAPEVRLDVDAILAIAAELDQEANNYEGGFADTVSGCAEELERLCAATIQEPVMVAEPVGDTQAQAIFPPKFPKFMPDFYKGMSREDIWQDACLTGWRCADAAPMVADPAGVAEKRLRDLAAGRITGEIPVFEYSIAADRIAELESALAATVKAIPSEALDEAAAYRMWRDCEISEDAWFMQHLTDYLPTECRQRAPTKAEWDTAMARVMQDRAPLADTTGGAQ